MLSLLLKTMKTHSFVVKVLFYAFAFLLHFTKTERNEFSLVFKDLHEAKTLSTKHDNMYQQIKPKNTIIFVCNTHFYR